MRDFTRFGVVLLVALFVLGTLPGLAAADTGRFGGAVVIGEGEVVNGDLQVVGGSVVVHGTVNGDIQGAAGDLLITGAVTGDVQAAAGSVTITGTVGGNVNAGAGSLTIADGATIGGTVEAGAASVLIAGTVTGDVRVGADTLTLAPTAVVDGDVVYDAQLRQLSGASVAGTVRHDPNMGGWHVGPISPLVPDYAGAIYGIVVSLVLGAILLTLSPTFTAEVSDRVRGDAIHSGVAGLLAIVAGTIAIVLFAITLIGIPIALLVAVILGLTGWTGSVLGQYAVGDYVLRRTGRDDRWLALVTGVVGIGILGIVPFLGGLLTGIVGLLGFGAVVAALYDRYTGRNDDRASPTAVST